jgi:flagella basal body P-ring formation protein FlgA
MRRLDILLTVLLLSALASACLPAAATARLPEESHVVSGDKLVAAAHDRLAMALAPLKGRVVIVPVTTGAQVDLPAGHLQFRARALPENIAPTKHMLMWVDVMADGRFVRAVPVSFEVSVFVTGWAVKQAVMTGSRIAIGAVEPREVDVTAADFGGDVVRRQEDTFSSPGEVVLLRADLRPGEVLTWKNAVPAPMVARGEPAMLRMHNEAIEVESRVLVLQDGFLGQTVKVKASGAKGAVAATVIGSGMVEAQE